MTGDRPRAHVVCGPTAAGKSGVADEVSGALSGRLGSWVKTLVFDSMQVYREIPVITNQARDRPAELVGVTSVFDEWNVARHQQAAREIAESETLPMVFDAGTGMYLNATLLGIPLAPRVDDRTREAAIAMSLNEGNPRRSSREIELRMAGEPARRSIWEGELAFETTLLYIRPSREELLSSIALRSGRISSNGLSEAGLLEETCRSSKRSPNASVASSIGVLELSMVLRGEISPSEAEERIRARTFALAKRQMRWFDKLARTLSGRAEVCVFEGVRDTSLKQHMRDKIVA
jgi:tRNA dimethylallyltransferase